MYLGRLKDLPNEGKMNSSSSISDSGGTVYLHFGFGRQILGGIEITKVRLRVEWTNGRGKGTTDRERLVANNVVLLFNRLTENPGFWVTLLFELVLGLELG